MNTYQVVLTQTKNPNLEEELDLYISGYTRQNILQYVYKNYPQYHYKIKELDVIEL